MADLYFMFGGDDEEELTIPVSNNLNHPDGKATLDTGYDNTKPKQATLDVEDDDVQRAVAAVLDAEEAAAKAEELANGVPMVHPDALLQQMQQQQQQQQQRISEPNGSFKARLDAWYADDVEDDDDEEDEEDAERNGSNTIDDQADTTISLLDDVEQPLSPLEQIYLLLRSSTSSQRIDGIVQLPELLPEIPPSDAVDYCVDLIYSLADDSEDSVRCALAEQLDRILAYYFINCMLPTANNKDVDHHDDEEKTERSENEDEEDEDTKNSKNELPISTSAITTHADIADGDEPPMATHLHNSHQLIKQNCHQAVW
ncbi:hypothetical protein BDF19DRAFT_266873 [Syncephalis fuscata]|nr:hypothetical protein BDF19DRAFT_266873 [Syncephalis fuscata]